METTTQQPQSQEQIIFANTDIAHRTGWNQNYPFGSLGNITHWVDVYCGMTIAEQVTLSQNEVRLFGGVFATFVLDEELQMPIFTFMGTQKDSYTKKQKIYVEGVKKNLKPNVAPEYFGTYKFADGEEPHIYSAKNPSDEHGNIICRLVPSHPEYKLHADKIVTAVNRDAKMLEALQMWASCHGSTPWAGKNRSAREDKAYKLTMEILNQSK